LYKDTKPFLDLKYFCLIINRAKNIIATELVQLNWCNQTSGDECLS
jgi:hypothetical protein